MSNDTIIEVENLWKHYGLPLSLFIRNCRRRLQRKSTNHGNKNATCEKHVHDNYYALKGLSFTVKRGETIGIIGHNGAGKSTLLKVLAGVTPPTKGRFEIKGRVFPMIELNAGMHPELTGRENVRLLGAIMGFSRSEIDGRLPDIEEFCDLGTWMDRPVRMYSSGMLARLGFSVALNVRADVLLIDEVMSVGDINFQRKCFEQMMKVNNKGQTILLVTHNVRQAERICERGINVEGGSIIADGLMNEVSSNYFKNAVVNQYKRITEKNAPVIYFDSEDINITDIYFVDSSGQRVNTIETGQDCQIRLHFRLTKNIDDLVFHIGFVTSDLLRLTVFNSIDEKIDFKGWRSGVISCNLNKIPLMPGVYGLFVSVTRSNNIMLFKGEGLRYIKVIDSSYVFIRRNMDLVALDVSWKAQKED